MATVYHYPRLSYEPGQPILAYPRTERNTRLYQTAEHLTQASLARTPPPQAKNANPVPLEVARAGDVLPAPVKADRSKSTFLEDDQTPEMFRARLADCAYCL